MPQRCPQLYQHSNGWLDQFLCVAIFSLDFIVTQVTDSVLDTKGLDIVAI